MKFLKKFLASALGIFLAKKGVEYFEKKSQNTKNPSKAHSLINKALPYIKDYLHKK